MTARDNNLPVDEDDCQTDDEDSDPRLKAIRANKAIVRIEE